MWKVIDPGITHSYNRSPQWLAGRDCCSPDRFHTIGKLVSRFGDQRGIALVEVLVALGILGFIGVAFMSALGTGFRAQSIKDEQVIGNNLVRATLEEIRSLPYADSYTATTPMPSGYSIAIVTDPFCQPEPCSPDNNLQKNTATVFRGGGVVVSVNDLKSRR